MGYMISYMPIQSMQYASRMEKSEAGLPVVPRISPIRNEKFPIPLNLKSSYAFKEKKRFHQVLAEIEGKGLIINETI
ncbi:hypothetical protein [Fictibacillus phosphorivorans]|uniref:hypothetical protein n=1 Tax=Fictibacillus phosphorivorans TaxID=1221500 RepID=UPI00203E64B7|nr:hypothetical protein [Fictibacillus phosphorivorans]MCM3719156.1 hypothetical protein [Fictibacillus phosphorivorans]MCM3776778.1 hypothetical protein [Fictibacillus phosphorivorans]